MRRALAVLLLLVAGTAQADELGRLFFTPAERAALDARRKARVPDRPAAAVIISPVTRIDGYVKRSEGPSTVWMNGESVLEGSPDAPRIDAAAGSGDGRVSVPVGDNGRHVELKPGQALDRGNGEVKDMIGDGEIRIRRPGSQ